jgi:iron complex outermembrane receptor protein
MNRQFVHLLFIFLILTAGEHCRGEVFIKDTLAKQSRLLDSVTITGKHQGSATGNGKYSSGTKIIEGSSQVLAEMQMSSLADFIKQENAVYLKEYGRGMGSYISVRGTSSSHTTVAWNGQNLAIPTMGQTDFSHIPLYFFDQVEFHIGGSSSLYGEGSIGGSLQLNTSPVWKMGVKGDVLLSSGSFGSVFTGATVRYAGHDAESRSSFLYSSASNDYSFINNTKTGKPKEYLNNAATGSYGFLQEFYKKFKNTSVLSATLLYMDYDKNIQPPVSLNDVPDSYESISDRNFKFNIAYRIKRKIWAYNSSLSYSFDKQVYKEDIIAADRFSASFDGEYNKSFFSVKGGFYAESVIPHVDSYSGSGTENRLNIYLLAKCYPLPRMIMTAGIRYSSVTSVKVPLMPSLDARYIVYSRSGCSIAIRGSVSGNCKIPTLNDRYWGGENMYLRSERSFTSETGTDFIFSGGEWSGELFGTFYRSKVTDWIRWLPAGVVWKPQNIPLVISTGAEAGGRITRKVRDYQVSLSYNLAYTDIVMKKGLRAEDPAIGEQLAYQPVFSWRSALRIDNKSFSFYAAFAYTGKRTTTDIYDILSPYLLTDLGATREICLAGKDFTIGAVVKNLFNVRYQNVKFYAMPGRNYQISLRWKF